MAVEHSRDLTQPATTCIVLAILGLSAYALLYSRRCGDGVEYYKFRGPPSCTYSILIILYLSLRYFSFPLLLSSKMLKASSRDYLCTYIYVYMLLWPGSPPFYRSGLGLGIRLSVYAGCKMKQQADCVEDMVKVIIEDLIKDRRLPDDLEHVQK